MFKAKAVNVKAVREFYALDDSGHLVDHMGNPAMQVRIGDNSYVLIGFNERVAYRRAVWACKYDSVPDRIFKIDRDGDESLSNLSHEAVKMHRYNARVTVDGRTISLGRYATREIAQRVEEDYKLNGPKVVARHDIDGYSVYEFRGLKPKKIHGPFDDLSVAHGVADMYKKFGLQVPVLVTNGDRSMRVGHSPNAYTAYLRAKDWIKANPNAGFNKPYAYFGE